MRAVALRGVSIALACRTFDVSETCFRYSAKLNDENEQIADLLIGLTRAKRSWGFGLCFLYLRNVRGHRWNHKRVYRIYRELELNLRIKPRKRLKRDRPDALAVPEQTVESFKSGVELTLKQLVAAFEKNALIEVNPAGEKFDPHKHQAIGMVESDQEANTVVTVLQKGYLIAERTLRPALVMVAKGK